MTEFEWDEKKRESNLKKHGIDFIDAVEVFSDTDRVDIDSTRNGEKRGQTIGLIFDVVVILLVHVSRDQKKRIISARKASRKEREMYYTEVDHEK
jgi:uncharacterized DUF497 family protein